MVAKLEMNIISLVPLKKEVLPEECLPSFTEEEKSYFIHVYGLMLERVIKPILEARNKEAIIKKKVADYLSYQLAFAPVIEKIVEWKNSQSFPKFLEFLRREVNEKILDEHNRKSVLSVLDVFEEHERYSLELFSDCDKLMVFFRNNEPEIYFNIQCRMILALIALLVAVDQKVEAIKELSQIAKKYSDKLEPFVATFQVMVEEELAFLRKRASEHEIEEAEVVHGSLLESR
ncbi:MAG: hypothetical protein ACUVTD_01550 [Nitrososphaerales archaeon]